MVGSHGIFGFWEGPSLPAHRPLPCLGHLSLEGRKDFPFFTALPSGLACGLGRAAEPGNACCLPYPHPLPNPPAHPSMTLLCLGLSAVVPLVVLTPWGETLPTWRRRREKEKALRGDGGFGKGRLPLPWRNVVPLVVV